MTEAQPKTDIGRLFATDPLNLTCKNIKEIIEVYRSARHQFNLGTAQAGSTKKISPKKQEIDKAVGGVSLKDLGIDI